MEAEALTMDVNYSPDIPAFAGMLLGLSTTTLSAVDIYRDWKIEKSKIEANGLFFYYKAAERFGN